MSTEVIGVGDGRASVMVREPVTVMTPISSPAASLSGSCAQAELVANDAETHSAAIDARKTVREIIFIPLDRRRRYGTCP